MKLTVRMARILSQGARTSMRQKCRASLTNLKKPVRRPGRLTSAFAVRQRGMKPGPCESPITFGGCDRKAEDGGGLGHGETGEKTQLDQLGANRVQVGEPPQRVFEVQQVIRSSF